MNTIKKLKCTRCGYEWWPRGAELPERCAKCNSPYWNKPRTMKLRQDRMARQYEVR